MSFRDKSTSLSHRDESPGTSDRYEISAEPSYKEISPYSSIQDESPCQSQRDGSIDRGSLEVSSGPGATWKSTDIVPVIEGQGYYFSPGLEEKSFKDRHPEISVQEDPIGMTQFPGTSYHFGSFNDESSSIHSHDKSNASQNDDHSSTHCEKCS